MTLMRDDIVTDEEFRPEREPPLRDREGRRPEPSWRGFAVRAVCAWGGEISPMRCGDRTDAGTFHSLKSGNFP
jgi:hypothetical protein